MAKVEGKQFIRMIASIDHEFFIRLYHSGGAAEADELKRIGERFTTMTDPDEIHDAEMAASDVSYWGKEMAKWSGFLAVIALYGRIEIIRSRMFNRFRNTTDGDFHTVKACTQELLKAPLNISHAAVIGFAVVEEVRKVNNNIKHVGDRVGEDLGQVPGYTKGADLTVPFSTYERFLDSGSAYLEDLAKKLIQHMP